MSWDYEDSGSAVVSNPISEITGMGECVPCIALFNPVFITSGASLSIDATSHLNHYIVQTDNDFTFNLQPAFIDSVEQLGIAVLITRDTVFDVYVNDSAVSPSIFRGLPRVDAKGDSIGLTSVTGTQYVIMGATRLEEVEP